MSAAPHQLVLPLAGVSQQPLSDHAIPRVDRVFVNRDLRMSSIEWVGFDMDYTLAIYRQSEMDRLSVELTVERLIRRGYPSSLLKLEYDTRFPIRGLLVDRGCALAIYLRSEMGRLSVGLTVERLIRRGYPCSLLKLEYETRFPVRGLLVDKRYGHVLKMDRYKVVHHGYRGLQKIPKEVL